MNELDHETFFVQSVLQLADKYGIKAIIDYENHNVDFQGECDEMALAQELEEIFGKYAC